MSIVVYLKNIWAVVQNYKVFCGHVHCSLTESLGRLKVEKLTVLSCVFSLKDRSMYRKIDMEIYRKINRKIYIYVYIHIIQLDKDKTEIDRLDS